MSLGIEIWTWITLFWFHLAATWKSTFGFSMRFLCSWVDFVLILFLFFLYSVLFLFLFFLENMLYCLTLPNRAIYSLFRASSCF